ncbi:hypothetical protein BOTBODRAFT_496503 [Botryobasidium botryosum FD-172 SS1]|uniref:Uncharacterized protein n=1 Tax=Botryobasidium botryosum (strain FD-172 SS1) TaxID=930990 RepID=A0A067M390_BOTB1|nr:hypothetical protein BOTBODRAFT_496503 [Botryobasidium botryosum FD-172 SS1]
MLKPLRASLSRHFLDLIPLCRFPQWLRAFNMGLHKHHVGIGDALDVFDRITPRPVKQCPRTKYTVMVSNVCTANLIDVSFTASIGSQGLRIVLPSPGITMTRFVPGMAELAAMESGYLTPILTSIPSLAFGAVDRCDQRYTDIATNHIVVDQGVGRLRMTLAARSSSPL